MYLHQSVNKCIYIYIYVCIHLHLHVCIPMKICRCVKEDHVHLHPYTSWNVSKMKSEDVED